MERSGGEADPTEDAEDRVTLVPADDVALGSRRRALEFVRRLYEKAGDDNIFFMAGAISFNVLVAIVPLFLFAVGVSGYVLTARFADPTSVLIDQLVQAMPAIGGDINLVTTVRESVGSVMENRGPLGIVGAVLLLWFSTRLVGTLRTVLREIFDVAQDRGIVGGKIFDAKVVVVGGLLFILNIGVSGVLTWAQRYPVEFLGLSGTTVSLLEQTIAYVVAFASIWLLFLGIYRFLPARGIPWRTALIAATVAAVLHELLKQGFGWYATSVADFRTTYGNLVTLAVLFLWIYYEALVFIIAGEAAQVWTMRRARRLQTRRALFGSESSSAGASAPSPQDTPA